MQRFTASALGVNLEAMLAQGTLTAPEYSVALERQKVLENLIQASDDFINTFGTATSPTQSAQNLAQDAAYNASISVLSHIGNDLNSTYDQHTSLVKIVGQPDAMQQILALLA